MRRGRARVGGPHGDQVNGPEQQGQAVVVEPSPAAVRGIVWRQGTERSRDSRAETRTRLSRYCTERRVTIGSHETINEWPEECLLSPPPRFPSQTQGGGEGRREQRRRRSRVMKGTVEGVSDMNGWRWKWRRRGQREGEAMMGMGWSAEVSAKPQGGVASGCYTETVILAPDLRAAVT